MKNPIVNKHAGNFRPDFSPELKNDEILPHKKLSQKSHFHSLPCLDFEVETKPYSIARVKVAVGRNKSIISHKNIFGNGFHISLGAGRSGTSLGPRARTFLSSTGR